MQELVQSKSYNRDVTAGLFDMYVLGFKVVESAASALIASPSNIALRKRRCIRAKDVSVDAELSCSAA